LKCYDTRITAVGALGLKNLVEAGRIELPSVSPLQAVLHA
jgi:hypothetical protein